MILISGEALIDLIPDPEQDSRYDAVLGGSPYNVAIGLGRLGAPTAFVSRISADANGENLAAALVKDGVDLSLAARDPKPYHARLRHARHGADRLALFLLYRRDLVRRPLAVPRVWPEGAQPSACRLDLRARAAPRRARRRRRWRMARAARDHQFRPQHPPAGDARPRRGRRARRAAGRAREPRQGERGGPGMALSRPPDRGHARRLGASGPAILHRDARRQRRYRLYSAASGSRSRRRKSRSSTRSAPATASCPPCSSR